MKFNEHFISDYDNYSIQTQTCSEMNRTVEINPDQDEISLVVNLLPAHPYQYPLHQNIKELLSEEILTLLKKNHHIKNILFLINRKLKNFYTPILQSLDCSIKYSQPHYPFQPDILKSILKGINSKIKMISWFEFLVMGYACHNRVISEIPLTISTFGRQSKYPDISFHNAAVPFMLETICENIEGMFQGTYITDHPFTGSSLTFNSTFTDIKPLEILVFPQNYKQRASLYSRFTANLHKNYKIFIPHFTSETLSQDRPCQKCLHCSAVCPAKLYPFMLSAFAEHGSLKEAVQQDIEKCTECGLCSYVCPSDIPLMQNIITLKREL